MVNLNRLDVFSNKLFGGKRIKATSLLLEVKKGDGLALAFFCALISCLLLLFAQTKQKV